MTLYEELHLEDAKTIIEKILKYSETYNKGDFKDQIKIAMLHLTKAINA